MANWRIKRGDKVAGNISSSKVRQLAAAGKLKKTDLLCKEGTDKWVLVGKVKGLQLKTPQQHDTASVKEETKPQPVASLSSVSAEKTAPTAAAQPLESKTGDPMSPQQHVTETVHPKDAYEEPPHHEAAEMAHRREITEEQTPEQNVSEVARQEEAAEPVLQQEARSIERETREDSSKSFEESDTHSEEEPIPVSDRRVRPRRHKWLVPLVAGGIASLLLLGLLPFITGEKDARDSQTPSSTRSQQLAAGQKQMPSATPSTTSGLSLTEDFFPPNLLRNHQYSSKKFENNTTVAVYKKTFVEKWNSETELYFHEKGFRNFGQKVPHRVKNGYVQLRGKENWFRFLKIDAKVGDTWTPGDGKDGTLDWTGKGKLALVNFETVDSVDVAVVEFTAKLGLPVPSYLVPAAFDFGFMEDGCGPIEGKVRFELGKDLGLLRADAIIPKGTRHHIDGSGRDTSDWIFATRLRDRTPPSGDAATSKR